MKVDLAVLRVVFNKNTTVVSDEGPIKMDWLGSIGLLVPTWNFTKLKWAVISFEKQSGCSSRMEFYQVEA